MVMSLVGTWNLESHLTFPSGVSSGTHASSWLVGLYACVSLVKKPKRCLLTSSLASLLFVWTCTPPQPSPSHHTYLKESSVPQSGRLRAWAGRDNSEETNQIVQWVKQQTRLMRTDHNKKCDAHKLWIHPTPLPIAKVQVDLQPEDC